MFWNKLKQPKDRPICRCSCAGIERLIRDKRSPLKYSIESGLYYIQTANRQFMIQHCPMCGSAVRYPWSPLELNDEQREILAKLREGVESVADIEPKFGPAESIGELTSDFYPASDPVGAVTCVRMHVYPHLVPFATVMIGELRDGSLNWIYAAV